MRKEKENAFALRDKFPCLMLLSQASTTVRTMCYCATQRESTAKNIERTNACILLAFRTTDANKC